MNPKEEKKKNAIRIWCVWNLKKIAMQNVYFQNSTKKWMKLKKIEIELLKNPRCAVFAKQIWKCTNTIHYNSPYNVQKNKCENGSVFDNTFFKLKNIFWINDSTINGIRITEMFF